MDEGEYAIGPFIVAQLTERQHADVELFRAMHNALSARITKLSAEIDLLSAGSCRTQERVGQSLLRRACALCGSLSAGSHTYRVQERVGQSLLLRACAAGTSKREQQLAVAQARVLVFDLGSTTPFLSKKFQDLRFIITDRVVNGAPVWVAAGGVWFMYKCVKGLGGHMMISNADDCAEGKFAGCIYNKKQFAGGVSPTDLPSGEWVSHKLATLSSQYASAKRVVPGEPWVCVPAMHITVVQGLDDDDPTMAAALQQLAAHG